MIVVKHIISRPTNFIYAYIEPNQCHADIVSMDCARNKQLAFHICTLSSTMFDIFFTIARGSMYDSRLSAYPARYFCDRSLKQKLPRYEYGRMCDCKG